MPQVWRPNVTVTAIVEREGRFLLVEEQTFEGLRINQPAGHLEHGESLIEAVIRDADVTYLRVPFSRLREKGRG